jgi:nucleoside-diphosphate-sugar epimerase
MTARTVLVAGASGLIGHAALDQFVGAGAGTRADLRSSPTTCRAPGRLSLDLTDAAEVPPDPRTSRAITHLVYRAALQEGPLCCRVV